MAEKSVVRKSFSSKHLVVMALGNIIGSGIFLGSGAVISVAGPAAVITFAVGSFIMLLEVMFIAEMSIVNPVPGSFRVHASEVLGSGIGFVNGWMFWTSGILGMASEVTAAAIFSSFWFPHIPLWVFCLVYSIILTVINLNDVRGLSRIEAILASVKVIALIIFIIIGFLLVTGLLPKGANGTAGIISASDFMPNGIKGILSTLLLAMFSYTGTGIIGMAVADTDNPAKNLPPAIFTITLSVTALYVLSILFIVLLIPWNTVSTAQSPFVTILDNLKVPYGSTILNIIVLSASLSGMNSSMYSASRMLSSLSKDRQAPALFMKTDKKGVPVYSLGISSIVLLLTALLSYVLPQKVFIILVGASGFTAMFNWLTISLTHYFYRKKTLKEHPEKLKFKTPGYPFVSFLAILLILTVLFTTPLYPGQIVSLVCGVALIAVLVVIYFILKSRKAIN